MKKFIDVGSAGMDRLLFEEKLKEQNIQYHCGETTSRHLSEKFRYFFSEADCETAIRLLDEVRINKTESHKDPESEDYIPPTRMQKLGNLIIYGVIIFVCLTALSILALSFLR